ncbi:NAD(P)H-dependent oxidoreductase [Streptomyces sasae]
MRGRLEPLRAKTAKLADPRLAAHRARKLATLMDNVRAADTETMQQVDGIGVEKAPSIVAELAELAPLIDKLVAAAVNMTEPDATPPTPAADGTLVDGGSPAGIDPGALTGRPVLIGATGGTPRRSLVLEHALRPLFTYLRTVVLPTGVYAASEDWGSGSDAHTKGLPARIRRAGREMASILATGAAHPLPEDDLTGSKKQLSDLLFD